MDERLNRSNRLPGSEKLTRPEEIGQLSKYLKSIKEVYEESTRLEDQVLGVSGYSTGRIPKIDSLGRKSIKTPNNQGENTDLSEKILGVPDKGKIKDQELGKKRLNLENDRSTELESKKLGKPGDGEDVDKLGEVIKKIQDVRDTQLADKKIGIKDERDIKLGDTRLDLQAMILSSLRDKRINLEDSRTSELETSRLDLSDNRNPELTNKKLRIEDKGEINLEETRLDIQDDGINSLENKRVNIRDDNKVRLEDKRLELRNTINLDLSKKRLNLKNERENELETKSLKLIDQRDNTLSDKLLMLDNQREDELGDKRIDLEDKRENTLADKRLDLDDQRKNKLVDKRLNLENKRENKLEDKRLDLEDKKDIKLEDTRLNLEDEKTVELENKKLDLKDDRFLKLGDTVVEIRTVLSDKIIGLEETESAPSELENKKVDLEDKRKPELSNTRLDLSDSRDINLGNKKLRLDDERQINLENKKLEIEDERDIGLRDKKLGLEDRRRIDLGNKKINLQDNRNVELGDKKIGLEDSHEVELEEKRLNLEDDREIELEEKKPGLIDERTLDLSSKFLGLTNDKGIELGEKKLELNDDREIELSNKVLGIEDDKEILLSEKTLNLVDDRNTKLGEKKLILEDERESELSDKILNLEDERETELGNKRLDLEDQRNINLENKILEFTDEREPELSDKRLDLDDQRKISLEDKILELSDDRTPELESKKLDLEDERNTELGDKILKLSDDRNTELRDKRLDLGDDREPELRDKIIDVLENENGEPEELYDQVVKGPDENFVDKLPEEYVDLSKDQNLESYTYNEGLEDNIVDLSKDQNLESYTYNEKLEDNIVDLSKDQNLESYTYNEGLGDKIVDLSKDQNLESYTYNEGLEDNIVDLSKDQNLESYTYNEGLEDNIVDLSKDQNLESYTYNEGLRDKLLDITENQGTAPDLSDANSLKEYTSKLSDNELYEFAMKLASEGDKASGDSSGWLEKVEGLMSSYLSSDALTPKRAIEFRDAINNTLEMSYFGNTVSYEMRHNNREGSGNKDLISTIKAGEKSRPIPFPESQSETVKDGDVESLRPKTLRVPVDTSSGTTWAKAEDLVGEQITGTNRRDALDEMIVKLVDYKKSNLPSIPGADLVDTAKYALRADSVDTAKDALRSVARSITGSTNHPTPINKPLHLNGLAIPGGPGDSLFQAANDRVQVQTGSTDYVGDTNGNLFYVRYWKANSFKATLEDLCPIVGKAPISSLYELKSILKASPYFTSPGKFMTDTKGSYNTYSLDTNMYWEVTIEPFCSDKEPCSNGGYSFLPSIREINYLNMILHGVTTNYGYWAPINSFELQKSKLATKSLPLYNGEISYPTGMDFTNDLRLTFVDDAWKSWKRYFERCSEVAVYNSKSWNKEHYEKKINDISDITKIDKTNFCIAQYKNLVFNIKIYILNPQLNLINKFNLLCILKDYSEEYVGEIDSGGTDLNVTFSIVGENPEENIAKQKNAATEAILNLGKQATLETQKRMSGAINSSVGLL